MRSMVGSLACEKKMLPISIHNTEFKNNGHQQMRCRCHISLTAIVSDTKYHKERLSVRILHSGNKGLKYHTCPVIQFNIPGQTKHNSVEGPSFTKFRKSVTRSMDPFSSKSRLKKDAVSMFTPMAAKTMAKSSLSPCSHSDWTGSQVRIIWKGVCASTRMRTIIDNSRPLS